VIKPGEGNMDAEFDMIRKIEEMKE